MIPEGPGTRPPGAFLFVIRKVEPYPIDQLGGLRKYGDLLARHGVLAEMLHVPRR